MSMKEKEAQDGEEDRERTRENEGRKGGTILRRTGAMHFAFAQSLRLSLSLPPRPSLLPRYRTRTHETQM